MLESHPKIAPELIEELIAIAKEEWNRELSFEKAEELALWLLTIYRALLED